MPISTHYCPWCGMATPRGTVSKLCSAGKLIVGRTGTCPTCSQPFKVAGKVILIRDLVAAQGRVVITPGTQDLLERLVAKGRVKIGQAINFSQEVRMLVNHLGLATIEDWSLVLVRPVEEAQELLASAEVLQC